MFKGIRGLLATLIAAGAIITVAIVFGFQNQKDDAATSRDFLSHVAAGNINAAYDLLHEQIMSNYTPGDLQSMVSGMDTYVDVSFPSISFSTTYGSRRTELTGTATTASGCESSIQFELVDGAISFFDITPLCRTSAEDRGA